MRHFRCLIRGEAFSGIIEGRDGPIGFYVNRFVEAETAELARSAVLEAFSAELAARGWANKGGHFVVDEIDEIDASELPLNNQGFAIFPDTDADPGKADLKVPFLMMWPAGFSVNIDAPSEPWMMTETAMKSFRNCVCYDGSGQACTIIDVVPLRNLTLRDRMFPWRRRPARVVLRAGPDLSLVDVRSKLVSILQADNDIDACVALPVDEAIRRVREAATPAALIDAAKAILNVG